MAKCECAGAESCGLCDPNVADAANAAAAVCKCHYCNEGGEVRPYEHYYREGCEGPDLDRAAWIEAARAGGVQWVEASINYVNGEGWAVGVWAWSGKADTYSVDQGERLGIVQLGARDHWSEVGAFVLELAVELAVGTIIYRMRS